MEALVSALPVTAIVYILALTPLIDLSGTELLTFTVGAVLLVLGIGLFNLGADLAMTPMGSHVGAGLSRQKKLWLLLVVSGNEPLLPMAFDSGGVASGPMTSGFILPFAIGACVALQGPDAVLRDAFGVVALVAMHR